MFGVHGVSHAIGLGIPWFFLTASAGCGGGSTTPADADVRVEEAAEVGEEGEAADGPGDEATGDGADDAGGEADVLPECAPEGEPCASAARCCPGTSCSRGTCRADPARLGEACSAERPCGWLDGVCRAGVCACSGPGETCTTNEECCLGQGPCVGGTCAGDCTMEFLDVGGACYETPCCGYGGRTLCEWDCTWPDGYFESFFPGCLDLLWTPGLALAPCTSDEQCCPWRGPCVAGFCSACLEAGTACVRDIDCCGDRCVAGACGGSTCRRRGESCASDAECCTPPCAGGRCGCQPSGSACARAEECCGGPCSGGVCRLGGCPETCATDGECCAGQQCTAGRCVPARAGPYRACVVDAECTGSWYGGRARCDRGFCQPMCAAPGHRDLVDPLCRADSDCCPGMYCHPATGRCVGDCAPEGLGCWYEGDCCGLACIGGVCTGCRDNGEPCDDRTECCSWFCDRGVCGRPCITIGSHCLSAADCCDAGALCRTTGTTGAPTTCCWGDGHECTRPEECCGICSGTRCIARPSGP